MENRTDLNEIKSHPEKVIPPPMLFNPADSYKEKNLSLALMSLASLELPNFFFFFNKKG